MHGTHKLRSEFLQDVIFTEHNLIPKKPDLWALCFITLFAFTASAVKMFIFSNTSDRFFSSSLPACLLPLLKCLWKAQDKNQHSVMVDDCTVCTHAQRTVLFSHLCPDLFQMVVKQNKTKTKKNLTIVWPKLMPVFILQPEIIIYQISHRKAKTQSLQTRSLGG